jgi:hypothetical protein
MQKFFKIMFWFGCIAGIIALNGCGTTAKKTLLPVMQPKSAAVVDQKTDDQYKNISIKIEKLEKQKKLIATANSEPSMLENSDKNKMMFFLYNRMIARKELRRSIDSLYDCETLIPLVRKYNKNHKIDSTNSKGRMIYECAEVEAIFGDFDSAWELAQEAFSYNHKPPQAYSLYAHFLTLQNRSEEAEQVGQQLIRERGGNLDEFHKARLKVLSHQVSPKQVDGAK